MYHQLPRRMQNLFLLLVSYTFYILWAWSFAVILCGVSLLNYLCGRLLQYERWRTRRLLIAGIVGNILLLALFKYVDVWHLKLAELLAVWGMPFSREMARVILPVGMSFYILQAISWLVDVYRQRIPSKTSLVDFMLYLSYFPKLTAGPIERPRQFLQMLRRPRLVDNQLLSRSVMLIVTGLFRKIVVADMLFKIVPESLFSHPDTFSAPQLLLGLFLYAFAIYSDFCGYTNIARGVSGMFGLELSVNFRQPFFATGIRDIWNRWHMTLSGWLRDYIYFPMGRYLLRKHRAMPDFLSLVIPTMLAMLLSGWWHGVQLHFIIWGVAMGVCIILEQVVAEFTPVVSNPVGRHIGRIFGRCYVLVVILVTLTLFNLPAVQAIHFWQTLCFESSWAWPYMRCLIILVPALLLDYIQYVNRDEFVLLKAPVWLRAFLFAIAVLAVFLAGQTDLGRAFLYQGF